ncbi:cyclic nucleotide-binding domain-containing protein [Aestuariivirga sp.]|jgi:predicted GNAT family N-acyltransferase|uniref:cyclic nucleotide-binding domain-containing protein n=1 Tax=Aestuariivirga sp. TaxID=2650926 RepID=UPI003784681A
MNILRCKSTDEAAQQAFRLRYKVFAAERGYGAEEKDHEFSSSRDIVDDYAHIYVAIKDGEVIATVRTIYSRDCDFRKVIPGEVAEAWKIEAFLETFPDALAAASQFAILPQYRGSLAAALIMSKIYSDLLDDDIDFLFSICSTYLIEFYSHIGFQVYSPTYADDVGFTTPIISVVRDWRHLEAIKSPTLKQLAKRKLCTGEHPSVAWFHDTYGDKLNAFVSDHTEVTLNKMLALGASPETSDYGQVSIFQSMSAEDITDITAAGKLFNVAAGQHILQTMQQDDEMYVVVEGEVLERRLDGELPSFRLSQGQVLGEVGLFTGTIRSTDFIAVTDVQLASISRQRLERLMKTKPELSCRLLFNLARIQSLKLIRANQDMLALYLNL